MRKPVEINVNGSIIRPISVMPKSLQTVPVDGLYQEVVEVIGCGNANCVECNPVAVEVEGTEEEGYPEAVALAREINAFADNLDVSAVDDRNWDRLAGDIIKEYAKALINRKLGY